MSSKADRPIGGTARKAGRIELLDVLRGIALLAMAVYHFTWDLEFFGYLLQGTANEGGWRLFARGIATSFLFLVGIGLPLAHATGIRWRPFAKRLAQIVAGAAAITVATLIFTPESFVFFGILHQIAVASVIGLLFLRLPALLTAAAGVATIILPAILATPVTNPRWLAWIGFSTQEPFSNDIVPIFPWTGIVLLGIAASKLAISPGLWDRVRVWNDPLGRLRPLTLIGRHSLAFYLIHQPVSLAIVASAAQLFPPDRLAAFPEECRRACVATGTGDAPCMTYCGCVQQELTERDLIQDYLAGRLGPEDDESVRDTVLTCSARISSP